MTSHRPTWITTRTVQLRANIHHHKFLKSSVYVRRGTPVSTTIHHTGPESHYSIWRYNSTAAAPIIQASISPLLNRLNELIGFQCDPIPVLKQTYSKHAFTTCLWNLRSCGLLRSVYCYLMFDVSEQPRILLGMIEDRTDTLFRNVGNCQTRRAKMSFTPRRKSEITHICLCLHFLFCPVWILFFSSCRIIID